jgi:hypothetical protein
MKLWKRLQDDKFCQITPTLIISEDAYEQIIEATKSSPDTETGGILIGYDKKLMDVFVMCATMPGPKAYKSSGKFMRDTEYCKSILEDYYDRYKADYVGEWHSHVVPIKGLSSGDIFTISLIMQDPDYNFNAFAIIVSVLQNNEVQLYGYISEKNNIYNVKIQVRKNF